MKEEVKKTPLQEMAEKIDSKKVVKYLIAFEEPTGLQVVYCSNKLEGLKATIKDAMLGCE